MNFASAATLEQGHCLEPSIIGGRAEAAHRLMVEDLGREGTRWVEHARDTGWKEEW